ncbi:thiamine pyrophosphate-dependent enzyme [Psychrobacter sp. JB385]|uniref:thiamine pyrophosphate-dependent enzyme n=1 Tax=Psychrobacter sp. JB385 TaxID=1434841 RepID=UPI00097F5665|nr:thiamine pyrophosphate-dependent enzyme [Psychrobacter sp. JB385]SJN39926.1 Acetolactate synthase large subunit [Psychrobacter sp. JB385]
MTSLKHGGQAIVDSLQLHGVNRTYVVPGESYLSVLDGLYNADIQTIVCRHEAACTYMADAHGKFTGQPGIAMVTRGPGAAQAYTGIHTAWQDGVPLILFIGLIPVSDRNRESFQEFDPNQWFGSQCKRVLILNEVSRASEIVAKAFHAALEGRPGPVVVGLPEDIIKQEFHGQLHPVIPIAEGAVSDDKLDIVVNALSIAKKPLIFAGGQNWTTEASAQLTKFAEDNAIPVIHDWRASDRVAFDSPAHAGYLGYGRSEDCAALIEDADIVLTIGTVLGDVASDGYKLRQSFDKPNYVVNLDTSLRGHSGSVTEHIVASPISFIKAISQASLASSASREIWFNYCHEQQRKDCAFPEILVTTDSAEQTNTDQTYASMTLVMKELVKILPKDAVYSFGAGNHCLWAQKFLPTHIFPSQLSSRNGAMGYSVPAGIAAALESPERLSIVVTGDGEFMMNEAELSTSTRYDAPVLIVLMDNQQFGTIRQHQEAHYPDRVSGTQLQNPDFAALANAFGAHGIRIDNNKDIATSVTDALRIVTKERKTVLLHVITDPDELTP